MQNIMIKIAVISTLFATLLASGTSALGSDLGVSVVVDGEIKPGVYGRIELGNVSHPQLVYSEPRVIVVDEKYRRYKPVYLHVPPGHAKHWDKHCHKYDACNRKVYFVKSAEYSPSYRHDDHDDHDHQKGSKGNKSQGKGNGKSKNH